MKNIHEIWNEINPKVKGVWLEAYDRASLEKVKRQCYSYYLLRPQKMPKTIDEWTRALDFFFEKRCEGKPAEAYEEKKAFITDNSQLKEYLTPIDMTDEDRAAYVIELKKLVTETFGKMKKFPDDNHDCTDTDPTLDSQS